MRSLFGALRPVARRRARRQGHPRGRLGTLPELPRDDLLAGVGGSFKVCAKCRLHHTRLGVRERVALLLDPDSFEELDGGMRSGDPLRFAPEGIQPYGEKLKSQAAETGLLEAAVYGRGGLDGLPVVLAIMDFSFIGASMGSVVGEKIAGRRRWPGASGAPDHLLGFRRGPPARGDHRPDADGQDGGGDQGPGPGPAALHLDHDGPDHRRGDGQLRRSGTASWPNRGRSIGFAGPRVVEQTIGRSSRRASTPRSSSSATA